MLWIIGGTSETGIFLKKISGKFRYMVTVATENGKDVLPPNTPVSIGRLDHADMCQFIIQHTITTVVDLSHPYAVEVSQNARRAAEVCKISYFRYVRERIAGQGTRSFSSMQEGLAYLQSLKGRTVFFTTGSTHVGEFQKVRGDNRFIYRVLPTTESLTLCEQHHIAMRDMIAALGPFSEAFNTAMFQEYGADYVVMKDSGKRGGTLEKLRACETLGITAIILERTPEDGIHSLETLIAYIEREKK